MNEFIKKIGSLVQPIINEKGELSFFALALREDTFVWDLLVAAEWIEKDRDESLNYLVKQVQQVLTKQELLKISAIILLRNEYYVDETIAKRELGWYEKDIDLYGVPVQKAYIFVAPEVEFRVGPTALLR